MSILTITIAFNTNHRSPSRMKIFTGDDLTCSTDVASVCMPIQSSVLYSFRSSAESKLRPISLITVSSSHASSIGYFIGSWIFSQRSR